MYELTKQLPEFGVGSKVALRKWELKGAPDSYYTLTRMVPKPSGRNGKCWGTFTWKGQLKNDGAEARVRGGMKTGIWKVIEDERSIHGPVLTLPPVARVAAGEGAAAAVAGGEDADGGGEAQK